MKTLPAILLLLAFGTQAFGAAKLQNEDFKSETDLTNVGSDASHLLNDTKVYVTSNSLNKKLSNAIADGDIGGGGGNGKNFLLNASFENATVATSWTVTNSTSSAEATIITDGAQSIKLALSAQTGDLLVQSPTPSVQLQGVNLQATCLVNTTLTTIQVCGTEAGVEQSCNSVPSTGKWTPVTVNMDGPSTGTIGVKVKATSSSTGNVYVDQCYVGKATNVGAIAQSTLYGGVIWPQTASCNWTGTNSSSFASFSASASCTTPAGSNLIGAASAPGTKIPAITFTSLPPGEYLFVATGFMSSTSAGSTTDFEAFRFTDGTNNFPSSGVGYNGSAAALGNIGALAGRVNYATTQSNVTIQIQAKTNNSGAFAGIRGDYGDLVILVYRFPSTTEVAFRGDVAPASFSGYHDSTCNWSTASTSYVAPSADSTCAFVQRQNHNMGTVTSQKSAGNFLPGIVFTPPRTGLYLIIAQPNTSNSGATNINSMRLSDGTNFLGYSNTTVANRTQTTLMGVYNATSTAAATIQIDIKTSAGTFSVDAGSDDAITWNIVALDQSVSAPLLAGSVTSSSTGLEHLERAQLTTVCTAGTCALADSTPGISSVTFNSTGNYNVNFASGTFSASPTCFFSKFGQAASPAAFTVNTRSSTLVNLIAWQSNSSGTVQNDAFGILCMGPR